MQPQIDMNEVLIEQIKLLTEARLEQLKFNAGVIESLERIAKQLLAMKKRSRPSLQEEQPYYDWGT